MAALIHKGVPVDPDPAGSYLFYLHGLIVEEAGIRPRSEEHGYYEYELILEALAGEGFVVISEARPKGTEVVSYAQTVVSQIGQLLDRGIAPERIIVAGASKGGAIGAYVSKMLADTRVNTIFRAGLFERLLADETMQLDGNGLSIHDRSDTFPIVPGRYFQRSEGAGRFREIVLDMNVGHGLVYKPYREWIDPLVEWVGAPRPREPGLRGD